MRWETAVLFETTLHDDGNVLLFAQVNAHE